MTKLKITMMRPADLTPNPWNPNRLTTTERAELSAEVERLGCIPKPIIARRAADGYEIIDGEQSWDAATKLGIDEVPVEIVETDDFGAMLQTFKRNQHGTHDRVFEGRMFLAMQKSKGLSLRALEKVVGKSQGYCRNSIAYAKLASLRSRSAPDTAVADVGEISMDDVRALLKLPAPIAEKFLHDDVRNCNRFPRDHRIADYKYAVKLGLADDLSTDGWEFSVSLDAIANVAHTVREMGRPWLDVVRLLNEIDRGAWMYDYLLRDDNGGPGVDVDTLRAAIKEATAVKKKGYHDPGTGEPSRLPPLWYRVVQVGIRDGWAKDEDPVDVQEDDEQSSRGGNNGAYRKEIAAGPQYIADMDWPLGDQVALLRVVEESDLAPALVEATALEAIAACADEDRDDGWATTPSEAFCRLSRRDALRSLLSSRPAMIERIMDRYEIGGTKSTGYKLAQELRDRLNAADDWVLILLASSELGRIRIGEGREWARAWVLAVDPDNKNPDDNRVVDERTASAIELDQQIDAAAKPKLSRLRELEGVLGGTSVNGADKDEDDGETVSQVADRMLKASKKKRKKKPSTAGRQRLKDLEAVITGNGKGGAA